jgi:hypothetical protein
MFARVASAIEGATIVKTDPDKIGVLLEDNVEKVAFKDPAAKTSVPIEDPLTLIVNVAEAFAAVIAVAIEYVKFGGK